MRYAIFILSFIKMSKNNHGLLSECLEFFFFFFKSIIVFNYLKLPSLLIGHVIKKFDFKIFSRIETNV